MKTIHLTKFMNTVFFSILSASLFAQTYSTAALADPQPAIEEGNLDRINGPHGVECNKNNAYRKRESFTMEAPIARVAGGRLTVDFFFVGMRCALGEDGLYAWGTAPISNVSGVILRNTAHSPIGYEWNVYKARINMREATNQVNFQMPLFEVMDDAQIALWKKGELAQVTFKVYAHIPESPERGGYFTFIINLDPRTGEAVDFAR